MPAPLGSIIPGDWVGLERVLRNITAILNEDTTLSNMVSDIAVENSDLKVVSDSLSDTESEQKVISDALSTNLSNITTNTSDLKLVSDALILAGSSSDLKVVSDALSTEVSDRISAEAYLSVNLTTASDALSDTESEQKVISDALSSLTVAAAIGGSDTQVQYNNGGIFGGDSAFTWDDSASKALTIGNCAVLGSDSAVFQPNADSTTFFQVLDADGGTPVFNVDTTNERVGIRQASPVGQFDISGTRDDPPLLYMHNTQDGNHTAGATLGAILLYSDDVTGELPGVVGGLRWVQLSGSGYVLADLVFSTGLVNGITDVEQMRIAGNTGFMGVGTGTTTAPLARVHSFFTHASTAYDYDFFRAEYQKTTGGGGTATVRGYISVPDVISAITLPTYYGFYAAENTTPGKINNPYAFVSEDGAGNWGINEITPETLAEMTGAQPYITLHNSTHEDTDGGRESRLNFKGEQGVDPFEETTLARIEVSHDGTGADDKGKVVISTNDGADDDTPTAHVKVDAAGITYIGDGGTTNYTKIEADGTVEFNGAATVWDDMRIIPGSFDRPGVSDPAYVAYDVNGGGTSTYLTEWAMNDIASFTVQLPHSYHQGEDLDVHLHWTPGPNGAGESGNYVGWKIQYSWANQDGTFPTMTEADLSDVCDGTDHKHQMTPTVAVTGSGKTISSVLICNITRTDTGADDDWAGTGVGDLPLLLEVDFHFPINTMGSRAILDK